jgi:acyl-CoA thioesterase I
MKYLTPLILATASAQRQKVITIGDSITAGMSMSNMYQERSYPIQLGEMLGDGYEVENFGVPGTMNNKESWFPYTATENF